MAAGRVLPTLVFASKHTDRGTRPAQTDWCEDSIPSDKSKQLDADWATPLLGLYSYFFSFWSGVGDGGTLRLRTSSTPPLGVRVCGLGLSLLDRRRLTHTSPAGLENVGALCLVEQVVSGLAELDDDGSEALASSDFGGTFSRFLRGPSGVTGSLGAASVLSQAGSVFGLESAGEHLRLASQWFLCPDWTSGGWSGLSLLLILGIS